MTRMVSARMARAPSAWGSCVCAAATGAGSGAGSEAAGASACGASACCGAGAGAGAAMLSENFCKAPIRSELSPAGSTPAVSISASSSLTRSTVARTSVTASALAGAPSRSRPIRLSAAWVMPARRTRPRKPQVPLMVWTSRKMLWIISRSDGSRSSWTSCSPAASMCSAVSTRKSLRISSMRQSARRLPPSLTMPLLGLRED